MGFRQPLPDKAARLPLCACSAAFLPGQALSEPGYKVVTVPAGRTHRHTVIVACHAAGPRELTGAQATGQACISCGTAGTGELIPVGVIVPPILGSGIAGACPTCAPIVLAR